MITPMLKAEAAYFARIFSLSLACVGAAFIMLYLPVYEYLPYYSAFPVLMAYIIFLFYKRTSGSGERYNLQYSLLPVKELNIALVRNLPFIGLLLITALFSYTGNTLLEARIAEGIKLNVEDPSLIGLFIIKELSNVIFIFTIIFKMAVLINRDINNINFGKKKIQNLPYYIIAIITLAGIIWLIYYLYGQFVQLGRVSYGNVNMQFTTTSIEQLYPALIITAIFIAIATGSYTLRKAKLD